MPTLSLNTSVSSVHKADFYTTNEYWPRILNVYVNYFSDAACPGGVTITIYKRIARNGLWKSDISWCCTDYLNPPCYQWVKWEWLGAYLYKPGDPDHLELIDKIAADYNGFRVESFVDRCKIHVVAKKSSDNTPLQDVEIFRGSAVDSSDFIVYKCSNLCNRPLICPTPPCGSDIEGIRIPLINCNTSVDLMKNKVRNDVILVGTLGIPNKLTWTISTPGIYSGTLNWQYWNGVEWTYFPVGIVDETNGFKNSGVKNVLLPTVSDWQRSKIMPEWETGAFYWCRAIYDSDLSVTTVPKASCLRWSGEYIIITNSNGESYYTILTNAHSQQIINIPGKLPGYICQTGCLSPGYTLNIGQDALEVNLQLIQSDLSCNLTSNTPIYKNQSGNIKVTSNVSYGNIRNLLLITDPDNQTALNKTDIPKGTNIPISFNFTKLGLYKLEFTSKDDGDNPCKKLIYAYVNLAPSCSVYTDKTSCEASNCFWTGSICTNEDPKITLKLLYDDIIAGRKCISTECIPILDLNNDNKIDINDKNLVDTLSGDHASEKVFNYEICNSIFPCSGGTGGGTGGSGIVILVILGLGAAGYYYYRKKKK